MIEDLELYSKSAACICPSIMPNYPAFIGGFIAGLILCVCLYFFLKFSLKYEKKEVEE